LCEPIATFDISCAAFHFFITTLWLFVAAF